MQIGRVIGDVVASRQDPALAGIPLLVVQPLSADGQPAGRPLVAVDSVGAGVGETVFFVRGKEASFPFHPAEPPADAGIVGILDHWLQPAMNTMAAFDRDSSPWTACSSLTCRSTCSVVAPCPWGASRVSVLRHGVHRGLGER